MRERIKRNFLATLAFSQGVPMISHGDELGRTQRGNNNAYCQDAPLTWVDWRLVPGQSGACWNSPGRSLPSGPRIPLLRRRTFFRHEPDRAEDLTWLRSDGQAMTDGRLAG